MVAEAGPLLRPYVAHVHVKDAVPVERDGAPYPAPAPELALMASVRPAGEGDGEIRELLRELAGAGYEGFLTLEPHLLLRHPDRSGAERLDVALDALRALLAELS